MASNDIGLSISKVEPAKACLIRWSNRWFFRIKILRRQSNDLCHLLCNYTVLWLLMPLPFALYCQESERRELTLRLHIGSEFFFIIPEGRRRHMWIDPSFSLVNICPAATTESLSESGLRDLGMITNTKCIPINPKLACRPLLMFHRPKIGEEIV